MKLIFVFLSFLISVTIQAGTIENIKVYSPSMKRDINVIVVLPSNTAQLSNTVYILHGYTGNPQRTIDKDIPTLSRHADHQQTIFVLPDGNFNSWYVNSPINPNSQYETFVGSELVQYIDSHYAVKKDRKNRGLFGWSMGGYGTLLIGSQFSQTFGILGSICGALDIRTFGNDYQVDKVLGAKGKLWDEYAIINRIDYFKKGGQRLILDCGTEDILITQNRAFHQLLTENKIPHDYIERLGKHDTAYWSEAAEVQLAYFDTFFNKI
ncbi:alpha/beta hydrolase [Flavobacterium gelatinilyticum]|uniref:alpha/beta hydrolase n=1 Tax=Flavobacterium gelatinilyticum TaxID=3003260 RepID=UPI00247FFA97|nr:alpha/beta hydrolase-fold protein [Flavobacterium gelatinilyticum]